MRSEVWKVHGSGERKGEMRGKAMARESADMG